MDRQTNYFIGPFWFCQGNKQKKQKKTVVSKQEGVDVEANAFVRHHHRRFRVSVASNI